MMPDTHGVLIVHKPQDWTSHDVCAFVRKRFGIKKVGHAGTLDPLATGVLVLLLGRATKQSNALSASEKTYHGTLELGVKTDTHDRQGKVLERGSWEQVTLEQVREIARRKFTGDIMQIPPMVSALKHKGRRLYELARKGITVPREARAVTVSQFDIEEKREAFVTFTASVSKGTYLRTLVNDLGEVLGCYATLAELCRMRSGDFVLQDSVTIDALRKMTIKDVRRAMLPVPSAAPSYANPFHD